MAKAVAASLLLVAYGNAKAYVDLVVLGNSWGGSLFGVAAGAVAVAFAGFLALQWGLSRDDLGLNNASLRRGVAVGVAIGIPVALILAVGLFGATLLTGSRERLAELSPIGQTAWSDLLRRVLALIWFDTAIPEEFAFRGLLLGLLMKATRPLTAVMWSAIPFALWHVVVLWQDGGSPLAVIVLGKLAAIFVGGLYFGLLRVRGRHLAAGVVAHWAYDFFVVLAVRLV